MGLGLGVMLIYTIQNICHELHVQIRKTLKVRCDNKADIDWLKVY